MKNNTNTLPFYLRGWFFLILLILSIPTYLSSLILLIGLFLIRNKKYPNLSPDQQARWNEILLANEQADNILKTAKEEADNLINDAKKEAKDSIDMANTIVAGVESKKNNLKEEIDKLEIAKKEAELYLSEKADALLFKETTVDFTDNITANEIKNELSLIQLKEKELIKADVAINNLGIQTTKANLNKQSRQLLRAFNAESDYYVSNITAKNVDSYRNKLAKSFENLNALFAVDGVKISHELLTLKLKQLDVMYKYQKQLEVERELLKAQKEEIREQQKVEKEIQQAKAKLEKEERQFQNEMSKLLKYLNSANNEVEQNIYADKIKELEDKIKELEKDKEDVLKRESNTRAGFVYIISNIGSFGQNVYKIGMTRRLEPMDRINELSSASVPFPFDVHALIFSEDAPALENTLHNYFRDKEVNKVNPRKEFFKVDLQEIKELVHKEYNNTVHFTDLAVAEQYYESIKLSSE
ncbi:TPA: DUF4041 domain-containing protein [Streptococcus suis]|uniref:DUF4041 domain-containing protein n=1 Tax=Streptococcus suis TaxID=1307 RepID=UPI0015567D24|nr:DUF4041 domain-containing protein [Streptococcus suis]MCK3820209.1 DUF4041 domain-containing protein [Streptococcus suis]MCK3929614.1 DUF4041 domain-containing protein [Streptococcus suis]MCK3989035.1 DUF4041 domain-containing protein [Streptococcus suis]MDN3002197.1 DUF4041 domain-containing protein [Streptococcus suis]MDN3008084.1 DUF4041 domain-containing protein [Streptococcus suis]